MLLGGVCLKKVIVEICIGTSCYILGAQDLITCIDGLPEDVKQHLEVSAISCLNACGRGPNVRINGKLFTSVNPQLLMEIIQEQLS